MASFATAGPDSVITVKINYDGCTRRTKMALRDMVPGQLERLVRGFLRIPTEQVLTIERYSDSAAAYVVLDSANVAVFKQLYRAAKAKSKLKLRVTNPNADVDNKPAAPRPVTVEDAPEVSSGGDIKQESETTVETRSEEPPAPQTSALATEQTASTSSNSVQVTLPLRSGPISRTYDRDALSKAAQHLAEFENMRRDLTDRLNSISNKLSEAPQPPPACSDAAARRVRLMQEASNHSREAYRRIDSANPVTGVNESSVAPSVSVARGPCTRSTQAFAVCCNSCDKTMPDVHYHCSTCDDGDFDLCSSCVDLGITCHSPSHWMIKRTTVNGQIVNSTTEKIPPKPKKETSPKFEEITKVPEPPKVSTCFPPSLPPLCYGNPGGYGTSGSSQTSIFDSSFPAMRTCNNCVASLPEKEFLHCTVCEDFDLCQDCFTKQHGHHPMHTFAPAVKGTIMPENIRAKMPAGRNQTHNAICDGCDKYIMGVRHKCLDCPDWDYCGQCQANAHFVHPGHRFVPIATPLADAAREFNRSVHQGICCDGPLCANSKGFPSYIRGIRYKCAVCDDVDFCASCEAHPNTNHNKTHPLIKIQTPIRHMNVTTTGENNDGSPMPAMGDGASLRRSPALSQSPGTSVASEKKIVPVSVEPPTTGPVQEKATTAEQVEKPKAAEAPQPAKSVSASSDPAYPYSWPSPLKEKDLNATFVRDTVVDGTIMPPNHVFEQSWVLRNDGPVAWPAGCSVKYVGGDYMGHVDSNHPAEISKLVSASESIVCYEPVAPGQDFSFTVLLRTPSRPGKFVSYWRLSTPDGLKFGHRLWCDVLVRDVKVEKPEPVREDIVITTPNELVGSIGAPVVEQVEKSSSAASSTMIFPKLDKESPAASMHEHNRAPSTVAPSTVADDKVSSTGVPDESAEDEDWDVSEDGFLTDEEYDILDASDEEFLEEQAKKVQQ